MLSKLKRDNRASGRAAVRQKQRQPQVVRPNGTNVPSRAGVKFARAEKFNLERKRQLRQNRISTAFQFVRLHARIFLTLGVIVGLGVGGFLLSRLFEQTNYLEIKRIEVSGLEQLSVEEINAQLNEYVGRSLYGVDATAIEGQLVSNFPFLKAVHVRKILPDKLEVEVQERFPVFSYVNIAGAYLVDEDGFIARVLAFEETNPLSADELAIIEGYIDPNSERIQVRFYQQWEQRQSELAEEGEGDGQGGLPAASGEDDSEEARPEWETVPVEDKQAVVDELRQEYQSRVSARINQHKELINELGLSLSQMVDYSVQGYAEGENFRDEQFDFYFTVKEFLNNADYEVAEIQWRTDFKIIVQLQAGAQLIFTTVDKNLELQLLELSAVEKVEALSSRRGVDLRGQKVAVW